MKTQKIMKNVYGYEKKDGTITYVIRVYDGHQKKDQCRTVIPPDDCTSKTKLERFLTEERNKFYRELKQGFSPEFSRLTFAEYFEGPCREYHSSGEKTWYDYFNHYRRHIKPWLGNYRMSEIDKMVLIRFFKHLETEDDVGSSTFNAIYRLMKMVLNHAVDDGVFLKNPLNSKIVKLKQIHSETSALTDEEVEKLIRFLENEDLYWRTMYMVMITTGMRRGEIVGLQWVNVHLEPEDPFIDVVHSVEYVPGKGVMLGPPKTSSSIRRIPLMEEVRSLLSQMYGGNPDGFVFHSPKGTDVMLFPDTITRHARKMCKKFGEADFTPHTLRRTFATSLATSNAVNLKTLQGLMGHADVRTLIKYYVLPSKDKQRSAIETLRHNIKL